MENILSIRRSPMAEAYPKIKLKQGNVKSFMKKEISHQDTKAQRITKKEIFSNKKTLGVLVPWWQ